MAAIQLSSTTLFQDANLQGYWKLEDVNDSGPNSYTLTNNGTCTFTTGLFGNGVNVATTGTKYLSRTFASGITNLITTGSHTWVGWMIAPSETPEGNFVRVDGGAALDDIYFSGGFAHMRRTGLTTNTDVTSTVAMSSATWYHVAGIYDSANTKLKIFVNGVKTEVTASGSGDSLGSPSFNVGAAVGGINGFDGMIDDLAMFNRALTDAEVAYLYNSTTPVQLTTTSLFNDPNLRGYWRFESNVNDSSSSGYNLTAVNTPTYATGQFGNGIDFESGSSQSAYIANGSSANLNGTSSRTISCWVKLESLQDGAYVMNKDGTTTGWLLYFGGGGSHPGFYIRGLTPSGTEATPALIVGQFYHVVGRYDASGATIAVFVNNVKVSVAVTSGSNSSNVLDTSVGARAGTLGIGAGSFFDGIIDDLAFFDRALTDAEVAYIYNSTSPIGKIGKYGQAINRSNTY